MKNNIPFSGNLILLKNVAEVTAGIIAKLKENVFSDLKRKGGVVGISGGIDSSVTLALAAKALGKDNVMGILLPEKDSNPESKSMALKIARKLGVKTVEENITDALNGFGCYKRRDEAVKRIIPEYNPDEDKMKISIHNQELNRNLPPLFSVTIIDKNKKKKPRLLKVNEYLQIVAASNFKQRSRMAMLYYHAERLHYAVIGTANRHETQQGFFVKYGDGGTDIMPICHLYKTQVYQLAEFLEIPGEIIQRTPTSDTYPAEQTQEEFFYQLPFHLMDILWYGYENHYPAIEVARELDLQEIEVENIFRNFARKQETTKYLRMNPIKYY